MTPVEETLRDVVRSLFGDRPEPVPTVLAVLIDCAGRFSSADEIAHRSGLADRHALYRLLVASGLPPLTDMARMIRVVRWSLVCEVEGASLSRQARREGRDPSQLFREVQRSLGAPWSDAREQGSVWVVQRIRARFLA